jgi:Transposase DDE domain
MGRRARPDVDLRTLIRCALPDLQGAERDAPRTGRGDKPDIPDWLIAGVIMVAVLYKKKSKSAQYRFLGERRADLAAWFGDARFPSRATYFRRYRRAHRLYQAAIRRQGARAIAEGVADPTDLAVDKSLVPGRGPPWHRRDRAAGRVPAGADTDTTWGYSEHDGWVQGYSYEVVVTATPRTVVFPVLASADTAGAAEARTVAPKIADLPAGAETVSADSGYDANHVGEAVEYDPETGRRTGRRFLCPENPRNSRRPKTKPGGADAARATGRARRAARKRHLTSRRGRRTYARRKQTVEPFNHWLKRLFELEARVWHRGLDNNRTQLLAAIFCYQLLVRLNHQCGNKNGCICWILDAI